jgi:hypothetical protein
MLDGRKGEEFDGLGQPVFSPNGKRLAHIVVRRGKFAILVDNKIAPDFDGVGPPNFSPDSATVEFGARKGRKLLWAKITLP